tara:strand:- start:73 stop:264 length:192 start_codon:yes stop_codon:yes gene_type:complete
MTERKATTPATTPALVTGNPEFDAFLEENGMVPIGGDCYEDAGGAVWHESNIEDEIKQRKKAK